MQRRPHTAALIRGPSIPQLQVCQALVPQRDAKQLRGGTRTVLDDTKDAAAPNLQIFCGTAGRCPDLADDSMSSATRFVAAEETAAVGSSAGLCRGGLLGACAACNRWLDSQGCNFEEPWLCRRVPGFLGAACHGEHLGCNGMLGDASPA